ncbi:retrotransposon protein, putative, ty1-copia subclass [Tanacetum coccineum]
MKWRKSFGKTIKALRQNQGGENNKQEFKDYLKACGIVQQLTPPYTPQHNGVSERRNQSATRILNMVPTKKVDKTPYELWYGKVPNLSYLKVWGCEALVKRDTPDKLQQIFVKFVARYAEFFEKNLITKKVRGRPVDLKDIQMNVPPLLKITSKISMEVEDFETNLKWKETRFVGDLNEPTSYKAAMLDSESNKWIDAMNAKIQSMIDNMVWVLVDLPPNCKTVRTIRILISIAAYYDYEIWQMDVKTAFLNGYLDEDIYMVQPEGFVDPNHPRKVCKLQRSIYGLKQASKSWNKRFDEEIKRFEDWSKRLIGLGQNAYMDKILKRYKMDNSKRGHIPMQERLDLNKTQGASTPKEVNRMQNVPYVSAVGSIIYEVRCTRPDVAFAQLITSRFNRFLVNFTGLL